ncbi:MAG: deoxyribodipyrimidine photolyase [Myxococcales bacterium]|nr:deoxyribodipyrimidine photolyase [Deltaproteobacteria bacterium]NND28169.1 deoxyribodipyrimidine photolyase [Myxococcales bacterium]MBT8480344.1 deoxyribodipyrimidine photolyase [Deltaproteobacteria bacterium]NNK08187.1 deoxyribodipyrimidine photolyase [Myxococcales bacterium]NNK43068.1 deoxyribodipyrimidine photolyase [Myxococcales bacterium]
MRAAPPARIRVLREAPVRPEGGHVLHWMVGFRRPRWNFSLEHAASLADSLGKPLVVLEALRVGYPWASDRLHQFILDGMRANAGYFKNKNVYYFPYVEAAEGEGRGLLRAFAKDACVVVSDDYPTFFIPKMQEAAASQLKARIELVDSNGLFPMRATDKVFSRAFDFRRHLQRELPQYLGERPLADPVDGLAPIQKKTREGLAALTGKKWHPATEDVLLGKTLATLPLDHDVPAADISGGFEAGEARVHEFLAGDIDRYGEERNHPDADVASRLSPWLHFGHVSTHQIFDELAKNEGWSAEQLSKKVNGAREGWWGMSSTAESFLDELVTWREVGFNMCAHREDYDQYESLPAWARESLELHESDEREHLYSLDELAASETYDPIWNAAQNELRETGRLQNYLRMLWGKKILEWSPTARDALAVMIELNNKYALDGRDPNSYSGIFWVLGRYDRAWGPERPIFGKIRYMSSDNTKRKLRMREYLDRFGDQGSLLA